MYPTPTLNRNQASSSGVALQFITREDFIMKEFWNTIQIVFTAVGGWLGWFQLPDFLRLWG